MPLIMTEMKVSGDTCPDLGRSLIPLPTVMFVGNLWNAVEVNSKTNEKEKIPILVAPSLSNL